MQPCPRCSSTTRMLLLAWRLSPPHVLTQRGCSCPFTSCVSLSCSTLYIHLQSQLQLSKVLFYAKQPTAIRSGLPPLPVPELLGWQGQGSSILSSISLLLVGSCHSVLAQQGHKSRWGHRWLWFSQGTQHHHIHQWSRNQSKVSQPSPLPGTGLLGIDDAHRALHHSSCVPIPDPVPKLPAPLAQSPQEVPVISSEHKAFVSSDTLNLQQRSLGSPAEPFPASKQAVPLPPALQNERVAPRALNQGMRPRSAPAPCFSNSLLLFVPSSTSEHVWVFWLGVPPSCCEHTSTPHPAV